MTKSIKFMSLWNMARKFGLESSNIENLVIFHLKTIQSSIKGKWDCETDISDSMQDLQVMKSIPHTSWKQWNNKQIQAYISLPCHLKFFQFKFIFHLEIDPGEMRKMSNRI